MKRTTALVATLSLLVVASGVTLAAATKAQTSCPVSGKAVDGSVSVDHQGQRVYFCCRGCPAKFKADPEKYHVQFDREGVKLNNIQTSCPVSGEKLGGPGEATSLRWRGRTVKICCPDCEKPFAKEPEKYLALLPGEKF